jgi:hypothetical protein
VPRQNPDVRSPASMATIDPWRLGGSLLARNRRSQHAYNTLSSAKSDSVLLRISAKQASQHRLLVE